MRRRILALALALTLTLAVFPLRAQAAEADFNQISKTLSREYSRAVARSGRDSLKGYCGLMTSLQIQLRGITTYAQIYDGKNQYDAYCNQEYTTGGHRIKAYSARDYSLEDALNKVSHNGTRDVYNILVGFHATNTAAGKIYGHSMMIYAILDGIVYFNESYPTPMCATAGKGIALSIASFANYYDRWTRFEGIVVFGTKDYVDQCDEYSAHMFVEAEQPNTIYTEPCLPDCGEADSRSIREVKPGERLLVTGLLENPLGAYFYRVEELGTIGYIPVAGLHTYQFLPEDVTAQNVQLPSQLAAGADFELSGRITSKNSDIAAVHVTVTDPGGQTPLRHSLTKAGGVYDLQGDTFRNTVAFRHLEPGSYSCSLCADVESHYVSEGKIIVNTQTVCLAASELRVGEGPAVLRTAAPPAAEKEGWQWEAGSWYFYENGVPKTGWLTWKGLDYYLCCNGAAATGEQEINGKNRLFTGTGALRTGWVQVEEGTQYRLINGVAARGWHTINGRWYLFDENGILQTCQWLPREGGTCYLGADGAMVTGWYDLEQDRCFFDKEGILRARYALTEEGCELVALYYGE